MIKKHLLPFFSIALSTPLVIVSCQGRNDKIDEIQLMKNELDNYILKKKSLFDASKVTINKNFIPKEKDIFSDNYKNENANKINLFKTLLNEDWKYNLKQEYYVNDIFSIETKDELLFENNGNSNFFINFSFDYIKADSFGKNAKPYINENKNSIILPVLVSLSNKNNSNVVSKFVDFFSLDIINIDNVNNFNDLGYNGQKGKSILFKNNNLTIKFQDIPNLMIDNYLDFNLVGNNPQKYRIDVKYPNSEYDFSKWKNKTFSEVKSIANAIQNPSDIIINNKTFSYSILESSFDQNEREYPRYTIEFKIKDESNSILNQANKDYGLIYYKKYSYVDRRWAFKLPSSSDIDSFKNKNSTLATELVNEAKGTINMYLPIVNFSSLEASEVGIDVIVERFQKNKRDFLPPSGFKYIILDDDTRQVSFEIESIEKENDSTTDKIKVNIALKIGEKDLQVSSTFSKVFNISTWKWSN